MRAGLDELPIRIGSALEAGIDVVIHTEAVASPERRAAVLRAAAASAHVSGSPDGTFADLDGILDDIWDALQESGAARSGAGADERHWPLVHLPGGYVSASQDLNELMVVSRLGEDWQDLIDCATVCAWVSESCLVVLRVEDMRVLAELEYGSGPYDCMFPGSTTERFLHAASGLFVTLRSSSDWDAEEGGISLAGCLHSPIPDLVEALPGRLVQAAFLERGGEVNVLEKVLTGSNQGLLPSSHYRLALRDLTEAEDAELRALCALSEDEEASWWGSWADEVSRLTVEGGLGEWEIEYTALGEYGRRLLVRGGMPAEDLS